MECAFVARFSQHHQWVLNLRVYVEEDAGRVIHQDAHPKEAQIVVLNNSDFTAGLDRFHFLPRTGNRKTFDDEADGYCRGGIGTVILKRLEDAFLDADPIHGVVSGTYAK